MEKIIKLIRYVLIFAVLSNLGLATLFDGDSPFDAGDGNKSLEWYGWYYDSEYPWIYHYNMGWVYLLGEDTAGFWMYHPDRDWVWTQKGLFPYMFSPSEGDYLFYAMGSINPNWFFHYSVNRWLTSSELEELPFAVPLYLRGTMNGWGLSAQDRFKYVENGYLLARPLQPGSYNFKVADAGWTNGTDFGGIPKIELDNPTSLVNSPGGGDVELAIASPGNYVFSIDPADTDNPVLTIGEDSGQPVGSGALHLLGSFNDFAPEPANAMGYIGDGRYHAELTLRASEQELRLGGSMEFGAPAPTAGIGRPFTLSQGSSSNVTVRFPKSGLYEVIADFSADPSTPQVMINYRSYVDLGPFGEDLYLSGLISGKDTQARMLREEAVFNWYGYLDAGVHEIVVSDMAGDPDLTFGGGGSLLPGENKTLQKSNVPVNITIPSGQGGVYRISLNATDSIKPILNVTPADGVLVHYFRSNRDFEGWGLHLWNVDGKDAIPADVETTWPIIYPLDFEDDFGRYAFVPVIDPDDAFGIVVHRSGAKDIEVVLSPSELNNQVWLIEGIGGYFTSLEQAEDAMFRVIRASARWLATDVIAWDLPGGSGYTYKFYSHPTGEIYHENGMIRLGAGAQEVGLSLLADSTRKNAAIAKFPYTSGWTFVDASSIEDPATALLGHVVVVAFDGQGQAVAASALQRAGVLDALFPYEGPLGLSWEGGVPVFRIWAPTARNMKLHVATQPDLGTELGGSPFTMNRVMDGGQWTGAWELTGQGSWAEAFYLYNVEVFLPAGQVVVNNIVTDPYSVNLSTESLFSQISNLETEPYKVAGWDQLMKSGTEPEDIVIYELHVRDFSIADESMPAWQRGTFKAFTQPGYAGVQHLASLAEAGLTHIHLLPMYDFASVNEDSPYLRQFWPNPVGFPTNSEEQQKQVQANSGIDGFNWGYDPFHFFVPEGSYGTSSTGPSRIRELREAVLFLDSIGLGVIQDVVFNHTFETGQQQKSVLDKIVPGYYYRLDDVGRVHSDVCCPELATENLMTERLMVDAIVHWARTFKIDGFRFDIMGDHTLENLANVRAALDGLTLEKDGIDGSRIYLYGEGWYFGSLIKYQAERAAHQDNLGGTGVGSFNDRIRDGLGHDTNRGFIDGHFSGIDRVRNGLAGNLMGGKWPNVDPSGTYTEDPQESVNYATAHDNRTLFDELQLRHAFPSANATDLETILRRHRLSMSVLAVSQGVPFYHAGVDILRSKSGDRNSYNSGDWFNQLDWTYEDNNWAVGLPQYQDGNFLHWPFFKEVFANENLKPDSFQIRQTNAYFKELLRIRKSSGLFRLHTGGEVRQQVRFLNAETNQQQGLIVMSITDPGNGDADIDPDREWIVVLINGNYESVTFSHGAFAADGMNLKLHPEQLVSVDPAIAASQAAPDGGSITVPGLSMLVYSATILPDLPDLPGTVAPLPRPVYLRGEMNNWGNSGLTNGDLFVFQGDNIYQLDYQLSARSYEFKVADANWTTGTNMGGGKVTLGEPASLQLGDNPPNMNLSVAESGIYRFRLDVSDPSVPVLTVNKL